jgi:hypothetical protein
MDAQRPDYDTRRFSRWPLRTGAGEPATDEDLGTCPCCLSALVEPVHAVRCHDSCWHVTRRCPECEWRGDGYFAAEAYAAFREDLENARSSLEALLCEIERGRTEAEIRRFAKSLDRGLIAPDDF